MIMNSNRKFFRILIQAARLKMFHSAAILHSILILMVASNTIDCLTKNSLPRNFQNYYSTPASPTLVDNCPNGPPLQWRPHLDASSKALLAPIVVIGSLKNITFNDIQLTSSSGSSASSRQQIPAQSVNNLGTNIEALFSIIQVLKRPSLIGIPLKANNQIKLVYRVSPSLSTTNALQSLIETFANQTGSSSEPTQQLNSQQIKFSSRFHSTRLPAQEHQQQSMAPCALELSEQELVKKANKLFKLNQRYVLYLNQQQSGEQRQVASPAALKRPPGRQSIHQPASWPVQSPEPNQIINNNYPYPFATHEQLTNKTSKALFKILCRNCGK